MALRHLWGSWMVLWLMGTQALPRGEVTVPELSSGVDGKVTLRLTALGGVLEFQLFPDHAFLAPGVHITHLGRDGADEEDTAGLRNCFYSSQKQLAAFSLCRGVQGVFHNGEDRYVVQPLRTLAGWGALGQHIVFKVGKAENVGSRAGENKEEMISQSREDKDYIRVHREHTAGKLGKKRKNKDVKWGRPGSLSTDWRNSIQEAKEHLVLDRSISERPISHAGTIPRNRQRRFVSSERFVEILLVADTSMVRFYGEDLQLHLLTLMSVASRIYKHPSLRNSVNLVVVNVLIVDGDTGPEVSDNGGLTLRNFCRWQQKYNPSSDRHPEHYDTAILITRQDFCGHESCDTLGVADIGTVCDPSKSCSVIEDDGLQAAYTLAHELAHVLSIPHDNSNNCRKVFGDLDRHHLMAPVFLQLNKSMPWSPCSAMHLTDFFESGHGDCLLDAPGRILDLPQDLPGTSAQYDLDNQCRQVFGKEFCHCPNTRPEDICAQLWCKIQEDQACHTKNGSLPWADGTPCGDGHVCWEGICQEEEDVLKPKVPVDGNWGTWGSWGECSRSCEGGVRFSYRECNNPEPENGGKYCQGQRAIYESCNTQECPLQEKSFREVQCEKYNIYNYTDRQGNFIEWIPKYSGVSPRDRCKLMCRARGGSEFNVFQPKVIDGTLCGPESLSVCVQGQCIKAGCDHVLHSSKKLDKCAVCGGDGSSCRKISGSLNKSKYGYSDVVTIPAGATNIDVKQRSHRGIVYDGIYLAIKRADGSYLLNGELIVSSIEQDVHLRGTVLLYSGSNTTLERLQSFHPLPEPLTIQILRVASENVPPKIRYTFFVPKNLPYGRQKAKDKVSHHSLRPLLTAQWFLGDWSACSKSCGSGWKRRTVECRNMDGGASDQCPQELRPEDIRACGDLPCPMWRANGWSHCSQSCGEGMRTQRISCVDYTGKETEDDKCDPKKLPAASVTPCKLEEC
ncbi:A disintegrin and metalloproteinase with thrombospondin motifs 8 [Rana temporaria]|uniref:A disintegrin and metalloproteinase with thrombospondin motifs 8 n=1 Tax=Rana temporaria TaxID=8407 RepID=UPI001AAC7532|nr:A disintegrin and metalloproteinase with thrombospondin motifs 8 [Rana temporaria]